MVVEPPDPFEGGQCNVLETGPRPVEHAHVDVSQEALNLEIENAMERAVWAAKRFVAQRSRGSAATEAPLAAYDLGPAAGGTE